MKMYNYKAKLLGGAYVDVQAKNFAEAVDVLEGHYLKSVVSLVRLDAPFIGWNLLEFDAKEPTIAYSGDAGHDLYSYENVDIYVGGQAVIRTGISVELPDGYAGFIWPRSGMATKHMINVHAGLIDPGYKGEIKVALINHGDRPVEIRKGDKIAQMVVSPFVQSIAADIERGAMGFGSSGV